MWSFLCIVYSVDSEGLPWYWQYLAIQKHLPIHVGQFALLMAEEGTSTQDNGSCTIVFFSGTDENGEASC